MYGLTFKSLNSNPTLPLFLHLDYAYATLPLNPKPLTPPWGCLEIHCTFCLDQLFHGQQGLAIRGEDPWVQGLGFRA